MKVAFIKCPWWVRYCPPYILAYFKTLLENLGHEAFVFDLNNTLYHDSPENFRKFWDNRDYYSVWENKTFIDQLASQEFFESTVVDVLSTGAELICFTTHTPNTILSQALAARIKKAAPEKIIVFMGHKSAKAQMAYDFIADDNIDYVCFGEADIPLQELIDSLESAEPGDRPSVQGFLSKNAYGIVDPGPGKTVKDLDSLPVPDYGVFIKELDKYPYSQPERLDILDSRGCVNNCHFCYEQLFWKGYRTMTGNAIYEQIVEHKKQYPRLAYVYFNGLLLNGSPKHLEHFCDLAIENALNINWAGQAMVRKDMGPEIFLKMHKAGCNWLYVGIESGSKKVLDAMSKNYRQEDAVEFLKNAKEAGIEIQINIMFGFPTETEEDFNETLGFIEEVRPYIDSVLASQSFCTLEKETYMKSNPDEFLIDDESHHLYWSSQNGANNYVTRFDRYERFCKKALSLGLPETSGVLAVKPDKWMLHGDYYYYKGEFAKAVEYYEKSLKIEYVSKDLLKKLADSYKAGGNIEAARKKYSEALELEEISVTGSSDINKHIEKELEALKSL